jgi:hypothetical protein
MSHVCDAFRQSAAYVHTWLTQQPGVKEESITDWLLYAISRNVAKVSYVAFSRHEEARTTGADWEWWILFNDGAVRLRVQAKRLFDTKDNYPEIARTNRHGLQIAKLLADSRAVNAFPLYAFYHTGQSGSPCPQRHQAPEGVHLASAFRVDQGFLQSRKPVSPGDALKLASPISCLVCCPMATGSAFDLVQHLERYHALPESSSPQPMGFHAKVPQFVVSLVESREGVPAWWEREFSRDLEGVDAVLVVDRRGG